MNIVYEDILDLARRGSPLEWHNRRGITRTACQHLGTENVRTPVNGKKVTVTSKPGDGFDACVYFGNTADVATIVEPNSAIYRDTPYGAEIARRRKIMEMRR